MPLALLKSGLPAGEAITADFVGLELVDRVLAELHGLPPSSPPTDRVATEVRH